MISARRLRPSVASSLAAGLRFSAATAAVGSWGCNMLSVSESVSESCGQASPNGAPLTVTTMATHAVPDHLALFALLSSSRQDPRPCCFTPGNGDGTRCERADVEPLES
jgi:hypothetical protein